MPGAECSYSQYRTHLAFLGSNTKVTVLRICSLEAFTVTCLLPKFPLNQGLEIPTSTTTLRTWFSPSHPTPTLPLESLAIWRKHLSARRVILNTLCISDFVDRVPENLPLKLKAIASSDTRLSDHLSTLICLYHIASLIWYTIYQRARIQSYTAVTFKEFLKATLLAA